MLFWSKVFSKNYAQHLRNTLKGNYKVTTDWTGKRCLGITLDWDCKRRQVNLSMPKYGMKVWKQFQHNLKKIHHQSFPSAKIKCKDWIWSKEVAQLDCLPIAVTQKINLPTNYIRLRGRRPPLKTPQKDAFTGDLNFSIVTFCKIMFDISSNNGPVKKFKMYADEFFWPDSWRSLRSFVSGFNSWKINVLYNWFSKLLCTKPEKNETFERRALRLVRNT